MGQIPIINAVKVGEDMPIAKIIVIWEVLTLLWIKTNQYQGIIKYHNKISKKILLNNIS